MDRADGGIYSRNPLAGQFANSSAGKLISSRLHEIAVILTRCSASAVPIGSVVALIAATRARLPVLIIPPSEHVPHGAARSCRRHRVVDCLEHTGLESGCLDPHVAP